MNRSLTHIKIGIIVILSFFGQFVNGQKEDYIWLGGYRDQGTKGYLIDFNEKKAMPKTQSLSYGILGANASICDKNGELLFYTNGCAIMNKQHKVMLNGDSINYGLWFEKFRVDCKYGHPGIQDVLIVNDPASTNGFYFFHKFNKYITFQSNIKELKYSYVDMSLDGGLGEVTKKNVLCYPNGDIMYSYFTGIKHRNKKDWWIVIPKLEDSLFLVFQLNSQGINQPVLQTTGQYFDLYRSSASGTAKFSPDGTKYALYNYYDQLHVYDFDRLTGQFSNHQKIEIFDSNSIDREIIRFSSVEWSPNSRFIYCASSQSLHQVDMSASNPNEGVKHIADYNGTLDPFPTYLFLMAQAPDCKIYMAPNNGSLSLHVINNPNELGQACNFVQNQLKLPIENGAEMPNYPRFRVDEDDKCDPSISSIFGESVYYRRDIEIYPSPSYGFYQVRMPDDASDGHLVVTDIHGKIVIKTEINDFQHIREIDISTLPAGHYNIEYYPRINPERIFYGRQVVKL